MINIKLIGRLIFEFEFRKCLISKNCILFYFIIYFVFTLSGNEAIIPYIEDIAHITAKIPYKKSLDKFKCDFFYVESWAPLMFSF